MSVPYRAGWLWLLPFAAAGAGAAIALVIAFPPPEQQVAAREAVEPPVQVSAAVRDEPLAQEREPARLPPHRPLASTEPIFTPLRTLAPSHQPGALYPSEYPPPQYIAHHNAQIDRLEAALQEAKRTQAAQSEALQDTMQKLKKQLDSSGVQVDLPPVPAGDAPNSAAQPPAAAQRTGPSQPPVSLPASPEAVPPPRDFIRDEGDDRLTINCQNSDIREVLDMLSQHGGLNILASKSVEGTVTASLNGVDLDTALAAILKNAGLQARREGEILFVGAAADFLAMDQTQDRISTRVYSPNYIRALDLQTLVAPLLTPEIGKVTVSSPAEIDIPSDQVKTGGNGFAGTDVVIVRDYEAVLGQIDQLFSEVDVKPRQVLIEAMILSVKLSDTLKVGVNFEALRDKANVRLVSGAPLTDLANLNIAEGGFKFGFLDASLGVLVEALESMGDTNVIASPRLMCLNKQRAEIQIGEELGYVSTTVTENSATQTVNFLDVGALLRVRPFIGNDGLVRLEIHPELSTGSVSVQQGLTLPNKSVTQVTTNIMCPDGRTVLIGGLIREDLKTTTTQIPVLGALPWVGPLFRQKTENTDRVEIIVVLTPRIIGEPKLGDEGAAFADQFAQRQAVYADKMSPLGRRNIGLQWLRKAQAAYAAGDYPQALKQANLAIHYDPLNRLAIELRDEIVAAGGYETESIHEYLNQGLAPWNHPVGDHSRQGLPWMKYEPIGDPNHYTDQDRGQTGDSNTLLPPPTVSLPPDFRSPLRQGKSSAPAPGVLPPPAGGQAPGKSQSGQRLRTTPADRRITPVVPLDASAQREMGSSRRGASGFAPAQPLQLPESAVRPVSHEEPLLPLGPPAVKKEARYHIE